MGLSGQGHKVVNDVHILHMKTPPYLYCKLHAWRHKDLTNVSHRDARQHPSICNLISLAFFIVLVTAMKLSIVTMQSLEAKR